MKLNNTLKMPKISRINNNIVIIVITGVISLTIGFVIGKYCSIGVQYDNKIPLIDIISILITVSVALYVSHIIERNIQYDRTEKKILIDKIDEIDIYISEILQILELDNIKYSSLTTILNQVGIMKTSLFEELLNVNISPKNKNDILFDNIIKEKLLILKRLLTETPIQATGDADIKVTNNIVEYTARRRDEIVGAITICKNQFFALKMSLNRL